MNARGIYMEIEGYEKLTLLGKKVFDRTHVEHKKVVDDESAQLLVCHSYIHKINFELERLICFVG
ncbi:hypothetical protein CAR_c11120 [Carnobacterium sp. 17-4]|nr:hypothetical protein CAR_c11120 [Carnobacterium sp. 17-4]